ncbi:MAG: class B sortase [Coriobacteriia bacterium]|nr:class B sortase [Coriobacteriia bacterium]
MARRTIQIINSIVNYVVLVIIVALLGIASYALWDSEQLYAAAQETNYTAYKPSVEDEGMSFKELQAVNQEVFSWLTVYGTQIDYPVTQAKNNMKYVNTNAEGNYSLSGAIFLDCENSADFSDFNNILYGHHMEKKAMFGEIASFLDKEVFDSHRYGNLYFEGADHGIEFFAFLHVDAYDSRIFWPNVSEPDRQAYLDNLLKNAIHVRNIGVCAADHIVLLITCSPSTTNGRDVLVGRIGNEVFEDLFSSATSSGGNSPISVDRLTGFFEQAPQLATFSAMTLELLLMLLMLLLVMKRRELRRQGKRTGQGQADKKITHEKQVAVVGGKP